MSGTRMLRPIVLERPGAVHFGRDVAAEAGRFAKRRGLRRTLVIADPFNRERIDMLGIPGLVEVFAIPGGEPDALVLGNARLAADAFRPDLVVGFGGGSAMDLAKLVAVLTGTDLPFTDAAQAASRATALVQVPTTAGTGSEAGTRALVTLPETGAKLAVESPHMLADAAVLDPAMTATLPSSLTAETGIDALAHCVESYTSGRAHPAIDIYAREGIRLVGRYLRRAVDAGDDLEARAGMALASLYGGYCLGPVNTTAGHAVAYPLSTRHKVAHGRANALIFPHILAFNAPATPVRTRDVIDLLGLDYAGEQAVFDAAYTFCRDLGIDMAAGSDGIAMPDIASMAAEASTIRRLLDHNPREITAQDIAEIYRAAL